MPGILCPSPVVSRGSVGWRRTRGFPFGPRPVPWFYFNTQRIGGLNPEPLPCSVPAQPGLGAALAAEILPFSPKDALLAGGGRSAPLRQPRDPCGSPGASSGNTGNTGNAGAQANRTQRVLSAQGPEMLGAGWKTTFNSCISRERCGISTQAVFLHFRAFWAHIFPLSLSLLCVRTFPGVGIRVGLLRVDTGGVGAPGAAGWMLRAGDAPAQRAGHGGVSRGEKAPLGLFLKDRTPGPAQASPARPEGGERGPFGFNFGRSAVAVSGGKAKRGAGEAELGSGSSRPSQTSLNLGAAARV